MLHPLAHTAFIPHTPIRWPFKQPPTFGDAEQIKWLRKIEDQRAGVRQLERDEDSDDELDYIECPWCGWETSVSWRDTKVECGSCPAEFEYCSEVGEWYAIPVIDNEPI